MLTADGGTVRGVRSGERGAILEGRKSNATSSRHSGSTRALTSARLAIIETVERVRATTLIGL